MNKYLLLLLLFVQGIYAQVEFVAIPNKTTLGINETLTVEFVMNADGDNFVPPAFKGFRIESGPRQRIITALPNGKREYSKIYSYVLQPVKRGVLTIGQAVIEIDGKIYKTIPAKINVTAAVQQGGAVAGTPTVKLGEGIYVVAQASKTNPYVNEPISVSYTIYVDSEVTSIKDWDQLDAPQYNGFASDKIDVKQTLSQGMFRGKMHNYITFEKAVLYPQKSGRLELEPVSLNVQIEVPSGRKDNFGNDMYNIVPKVIASQSVAINVRPLPDKGKPANHRGAVGDFTFKITPSKTTVKSGESLQLTVSVSGKGNLKLFNLPRPVVPAALEMYDPEHKESVSVSSAGTQGTISDNYTIIPQFKGKFTIRPIALSFFDPKLGVYRSISSDEITITVPTGPAPTEAAYQDAVGTKKQPVEGEEQFRYIALKTQLEPIGKGGFYGSVWYYILLVAPLLVIPGIVAYKRTKTAAERNVEAVKAKETNKRAKHHLAEAQNYIGNKEQFYISLEKAMHNFLRSKLNIETSQMSKQNIRTLLLSKKAHPDTVEDLITLMNNCEMARYAPSTNVAMQQDYAAAERIVALLEKQI